MLTLDLAARIIAGSLAAARDADAKPIAVIVLDAGGHPVAFQREDGASLFRFNIARAKATGALGMGEHTRALAERAAKNPTFFSSLAVAADGQIAFSPGGLLVRDAEGRLLGAVGISGDTGEVDEVCALAGLAAAGLSRGVAA